MRSRRLVAVAAATALVGLPVLAADASTTGATATLTGSVTGAVVPPITVVAAADQAQTGAWRQGTCPATGRGGYNGQPFSLYWQADTTGTVDHYLVTMTLLHDSGGSLAAATGSSGWEGNSLFAGFGQVPAGTTAIPPTRLADATWVPQGMTATQGGAAIAATSNVPVAVTAPANSVTWKIPNTVAQPTGGHLEASQLGPTRGVQWGVSFPAGWFTNLAGTVTVIAVGPGGWQSAPTTYYWWLGYGGAGGHGSAGDQATNSNVGCSRTCQNTTTPATGTNFATTCTS